MHVRSVALFCAYGRGVCDLCRGIATKGDRLAVHAVPYLRVDSSLLHVFNHLVAHGFQLGTLHRVLLTRHSIA